MVTVTEEESKEQKDEGESVYKDFEAKYHEYKDKFIKLKQQLKRY